MLLLDIRRVCVLSTSGSPGDVLSCQSAVEAASPDSHDDATNDGNNETNGLANSDSGLLELCLDLVDVAPVRGAEVENKVRLAAPAAIQDDVTRLVILLLLKVINEVTDLFFVPCLVFRLC